ncbi:MAG: hypothetical protein ABSE51_08255 [Terracidiphilus sp.]|jgi:hypothetical protein
MKNDLWKTAFLCVFVFGLLTSAAAAARKPDLTLQQWNGNAID